MKVLNRLAKKGITISLVWIKAHVGHPGKERADWLAKQATSDDNSNCAWVKFPGNALKKKSLLRLHSTWREEWNSYSGARMFQQFFPTINLSISDKLVALGREDLTNIITMISGHNDLRYHYSLRDQNINPKCRLCGNTDETFYHLLVDCPSLNSLRFKITGRYSLGSATGWTPDKLIEFICDLPFDIHEPNSYLPYSFSSSSLFFIITFRLLLYALWGREAQYL